MIFLKRDDEEEVENPEDEEATLADDLLDEVGDDPVEADEEIEGFGLIAETEVAEEEEEEKEDEEEEASLDEDAEDVDFDTFDDVDEM
jgi:hypothetical protein